MRARVWVCQHAGLGVVEVLVDELQICPSAWFLSQLLRWPTHVVGGLAEVSVGGKRHGGDDSGRADAAVEGLADVGEVGGRHYGVDWGVDGGV